MRPLIVKRLFLIMVFAMLQSYPLKSGDESNQGPSKLQKFTIQCRVSYPSNFFNVLDNLSQWGPRTYEKYVIYWKERFGLSEEDQSFLKEYCQIRRKYVGRVAEDKDKQELIEANSAVPLPPLDSDLGKKFILLIAGAETLEALAERAEVLLSQEDRSNLLAVIEHFKPKFDAIWEDADYLERKAEELTGQMRNERVKEMLKSIARFFGRESYSLPDFELHLLWTPDVQPSFGQTVERYSLVEVYPQEDMRLQVDKHIHEVCHYLYDSLPLAVRLDLANLFFKDGQIEGPLAYNFI